MGLSFPPLATSQSAAHGKAGDGLTERLQRRAAYELACLPACLASVPTCALAGLSQDLLPHTLTVAEVAAAAGGGGGGVQAAAAPSPYVSILRRLKKSLSLCIHLKAP